MGVADKLLCLVVPEVADILLIVELGVDAGVLVREGLPLCGTTGSTESSTSGTNP